MKNIILFLLLAMSLSASAHTTPVKKALTFSEQSFATPAFSFIRGHKQGRHGYALQWSMTTNSGITHFQIQSTYEDPMDVNSNWTNEGFLNNANANIIRFIHQGPLPGIISYRIIAVLNNGGGNVVSEIFMTVID